MQLFKAFLPLAVAGCVLTSCGGGKIPPTQYYQLDLPAAPAQRPAQPLNHTVVVMPWRAADMLTDDRIIYRPSREEVGFYEYHRWAEDPREGVERAMKIALESRGTFSSIGSFDGRTRSDYMLRGCIERLEEVDFEGGVKVYVTISAELLESSNARVVWTDRRSADGTVTTSDVRQVVERMSSAARECVDELAGSLDEFLRK